MKLLPGNKKSMQNHFAQKRTALAETFQTALKKELLDRETVNSLDAIICGDATIDYLVLGTIAPVAAQYAASVYEHIQAQQPVLPFNNKKECHDPISAQQHYVATYETYRKQQTQEALLAFYKEQHLISRAYLAATAAYLTREEKDKEKREKERPHWKIFWIDIKKQKHAVCLTDPVFAPLLATQKMDNAMIEGYAKIQTAGKTARDILETKYYGFACAEAKKYQQPQFRMEELIDEAMGGISAAIDRYDYKRGILFTTYAKFWTKVKLHRFTEQGKRPVYLSRGIHEAVNVFELVERDFRQRLQCEPTDTLLLKEMIERGYKEEVAREALSVMRQQVLFLDQENAHDAESLQYDFISDPQKRDLTEEISRHGLAQNMRHALTLLDPRLRMVLELRYRVNDTEQDKPDKYARDLMSLNEVAEIVSVREGREQPFSRELMRQLESKAFDSLREILKRPKFAYIHEELEQE